MTTTVDLAPSDAARLIELEQVVDTGLSTFVAVGRALAEISSDRLYRTSHATFAEYAADRFGIGRSYAYRMINAAKVADLVSPMGDIHTERQARELTGLPVNMAQTTVAVASGMAKLLRGPEGQPTADELREARTHVTAAPLASVTEHTPESARALTDRVVESIAALPVDESWAATIDAELAASDPDYRAIAERVTPDPVTPERAPVVGVDGKTYPQPKRGPYRKPLPDAAKDKGFALRAAVDAVERLFDDNRYRGNEKQVALALRGHLLHVQDRVAALLDQLP